MALLEYGYLNKKSRIIPHKHVDIKKNLHMINYMYI